MVGQSLNQYSILERVGAGGMGVVYRARDQRLRRDVALKILPPAAAGDSAAQHRLLDEARLASSLNHPHICTIYEVGEADGQIFIAMEFVEGETLSSLIPADGLPTETVLRYGAQIAAGLEHAHARGIVHRDLKCANVRVGSEGRCTILDFGLAARQPHGEPAAETQSEASPARDDAISGTLAYMPPETLRGEPANPRGDIWSLGVMLHEMLSGSLPFRGATAFAVSSAILRDPPGALPERVPPGLRDVVRRCLTKDPAGRYQKAGEVRAALEAIHSDRGVPQHEHAGEKRSRLRAALAIALCVLVAAAIGYILRRPPPVIAQRLAILPIYSLGPDPKLTAFGDGLTETLNARLAPLAGRSGLRLIPVSAMRARRVASLQQAREEFGANLCVELSIHSAGEMVRVTYSLVDTDAESFREIGAGTLTAGMANQFDVEDQLAERVLSLVGGHLQKRTATEGPPATPIESAQPREVVPGPAPPSPPDGKISAPPGSRDARVLALCQAGNNLLGSRYTPGATEQAISSFRKALDLDLRSAPAYAGLGHAYWALYEQTKERRWVDEAEAACRKSVSLAKDSATGYECLGRVSTGRGKYETAVQEYQRALSLDPRSSRAALGLGDAYESLSRPKEAEQSFRRAVAQQPGVAENYNRLGAYYLRHGRLADAARMFSEVIALAPESLQGYSNLGSTYVVEGRYADAIPQLELSLAIHPTAEATSNLGTAYFQLRRYRDAVRIFEQAVKLDEKNYEVWGNLADSYYWAQGERPRAAPAYRKAIDLAEEKLRVNPRDSSLLGYLAAYYAMTGDRSAALDRLGRALALAPHDGELLFYAAVVHQQLGDSDQALSSLEKAVAAGLSTAILQDSPNFDSLRDKSRFQALVSAR
jgi:serine/threonine-protein kinase